MRKAIKIVQVANGFYVRLEGEDHFTVTNYDEVLIFANAVGLSEWVEQYFEKPAPPPLPNAAGESA